MTRAGIGGEFETPDLGVPPRSSSAAALFVPDGAVMTASGRQALNLIAQRLRAGGVTTLLVPAHYCTTMVLPFQLEGIRARLVEVDDRCLLSAPALREALAVAPGSAGEVAILHCETYGNRAGPELADELAAAHALGARVVVDQTHSLLDGPARGQADQPADYRVASLRKLLPVPDGAWVTGLGPVPRLPRRDVDARVTRLRVRAAAARRAGRAESDALFERAELLMDDAFEPSTISARAAAVLAGLDGTEVLARRRANGAYLRDMLVGRGVEVINPEAAAAMVVVGHPRGPDLLRALTAARIDGPVHWPRPAGLPVGATWRDELVSLPVDQRYDRRHMEIVAEWVVRF